jgi:recombination protein RecA
MFSMSALASVNLDATALARLGVLQGTEALLPSRAVLGLRWPELEHALPDRGLPRGVVEIAALPRLASRGGAQRCPDSMRGGATSIAIAAMSAVHAADEHAWCAWITPQTGDAPSLYAPALAQAGVDLDRLLVVRPSAQALARTVVKVAASGAFTLLVIDIPHRHDLSGGKASPKHRGTPGHDAGAVVVRKLALAAEESGTTSLLLTSALSPRTVPWPVAMRIEVERRPDALSLRVTKDRRGNSSSQHVVRIDHDAHSFAVREAG